jgi:endonuclease G
MTRRSSSKSQGALFKSGIFVLLATIAYWFFNQSGGSKPSDTLPSLPDDQNAPAVSTCQVPDEMLPAVNNGELVRHTYYVLSYDEEHEQAEWVAYELTRERLNQEWADRPQGFFPDPLVRTESATPRDYSGSGYDRGHLCPAADMAFDEAAIKETFYMSNISPQVRTFNGGVWRELEELTRDWARKYEHLYVVTGPVLTRSGVGAIGFNKVTVPAAYYKILLAKDRSIAFMLPNEQSDRPVMDYACSIDAVEEITGIDFFPRILKGADESLEAECDRSLWPVSVKRYERRLLQWNKQ